MNKMLDKLERCLISPLDRVEERYGQVRVEFWGAEDDIGPTLVLTIEDGVARCAVSSCLSTRGWLANAQAYGRAAGFMMLSGLVDDEA